MAQRRLRENAHAGGVWTSLARLRNILRYGHAALRRPTKARPKQREVVRRYLVLHGLITTLGHVREAADLLVKAQPSLRSVMKAFEKDFTLWTKFRNDAAHVVERTHYESLPSQNEAIIDMDQYGYDTDVLKYEEDTDTVRTGLNDEMCLGAAIDRAEELTLAMGEAISKGYRDGSILPPPRFRKRDQEEESS
jgi:hypothetical protein